MALFLIVVTLFVVFHVIPALPQVRLRLVAMIGERRFLMGYGILSTLLLFALFTAYFDAPYMELWEPVEALKWVPLLAMPIAWVLAVAGLLSPNPLSISFIPADRFNPSQPGIVAVVRHPAIWAMGIWSGAHIPPNGDVASVIMFGLLTALCVYGPLSLNKKKQQRLGLDRWRELAARTSEIPFAALIRGRTLTNLRDIGWWKILAGLLLYAGFLMLHQSWIGVSPLPLTLM